jgi:hypothetical protein
MIAETRLDWNLIRYQVILRDGRKCSNCGIVADSLDVHHIKPRRYGGTDDMDNLTTLCRKCHIKLETVRPTKLPRDTTMVSESERFGNGVRSGIPASVRNALNLKAGDSLIWEISHDGIKVFVKVTRGDKKE